MKQISIIFLILNILTAVKTASASPTVNNQAEVLYEVKRTKESPKKSHIISREVSAENDLDSKEIDEKNQKSISKKRNQLSDNSGNLPLYFSNLKSSSIGKQKLLLPQNVNEELPFGLKSGDILNVEIPHSILAFSDEKTPVIATIKSGPYKGRTLVGESKLEENSERIFVKFFQVNINGVEHKINSNIVSSDGNYGLTGNFYSKELVYTSADFVSQFMGAYFDAQIPRKQNVFGQDIQDNSVDSAVKKGLSSSSLALAERFKEKLKKGNSFSEIKGPFEAKVMILSTNLKQSNNL